MKPLSTAAFLLPALLLPLVPLSGCRSTEEAPTGPSVVKHLAAAEFGTFIQTPQRLLVVDFYADWCGPCRLLSPKLESLAKEFPDTVTVAKLNVDEAQEIAARENVRSIPDVRFYRDGKRVDGFVGVISETEIRQMLQRHSADLKPAPRPAEKAQDGTSTGTGSPKITPAPREDSSLPPGMQRR